MRKPSVATVIRLEPRDYRAVTRALHESWGAGDLAAGCLPEADWDWHQMRGVVERLLAIQAIGQPEETSAYSVPPTRRA